MRRAQSLRRLAASADAADLVIDVRVFLFEVILGDCGRRGDIGSTRLTVAQGRRPWSGRGFFSGHRWTERGRRRHGITLATGGNSFALGWRRSNPRISDRRVKCV